MPAGSIGHTHLTNCVCCAQIRRAVSEEIAHYVAQIELSVTASEEHSTLRTAKMVPCITYASTHACDHDRMRRIETDREKKV